MKKYTVLCAGLCMALAMTSCKTNESAYKKAYEKAKQYDTAQQQAAPVVETAPVVAPVEAKPATETQVVDNLDNVSVRQESVSLISGSGLKAFSVVVGSFGVRANAQIVKNDDKNMYRVIASTFSDKAAAAASRDQIRASYPDAWLLYNAR